MALFQGYGSRSTNFDKRIGNKNHFSSDFTE